MKLKPLIVAITVLILPSCALAVSDNAQGANANAPVTSTSTSPAGSNDTTNTASTASQNQGTSTGSQAQVENQTRTQTQTQTNNPGTGALTQTQTQTEEQTRIQEAVKTSAPKYTPTNSRAAGHKSIVANAVQSLIQSSYQIKNTGLGDQIRTIAQTQSKNQDKIGQSIDNADKRGSFAKFFIGANYKELKEAKTTMEQNRTQIRELEQLMTQIDNEGDKLAIANQIIVLQNQQIELREQLSDMTSGFSLFGWIARWRNNW